MESNENNITLALKTLHTLFVNIRASLEYEWYGDTIMSKGGNNDLTTLEGYMLGRITVQLSLYRTCLLNINIPPMGLFLYH